MVMIAVVGVVILYKFGLCKRWCKRKVKKVKFANEVEKYPEPSAPFIKNSNESLAHLSPGAHSILRNM